MYPFLFINGGQATPHRDDIAIFSTLYPEPTFAATTATISGRILGPNRTTPLTGVNVIARNVASPYDDAVSAISSDFTNDYTEGAPLVGRYRLRGLTPGASYAVFVDQILAGGFSTPPRDAAQRGGAVQRRGRIQQRRPPTTPARSRTCRPPPAPPPPTST